MIRYFLLLSLLIGLAPISALAKLDQGVAHKLFKSALSEYKDLSNEYLEVLDKSREEMRNVRQVNLSVRFDSKLSGMEKQLLESNESLIVEIENYANKHGVSALDDVLLMRLANLHYRRSQMLWGFEDKVYSTRLKAYIDGRSKVAPTPPSPDFKKTIFYCKQLIKKYPQSPFGDQAFYMLGISLEEMGVFDQAAKIFEEFLERHSSSPLSDEIMWRLAEYNYDSRKIKEAAKLYDRIIEIENSSFRMKSIYKMGASFFESGKYNSALPYFMKLYNETRDQRFGNSESQTFYDESLEYLGILYEKGFSVQIDEKGLGKAVLSLAGIYRRDAQEALARRVLLKYLKENPLSEDLPSFAEEILDSYIGEGLFAQANKFRLQTIALLQDSRNWWNRNRSKRTAQFEAQDFLESEVLAAAQYLVEIGFEKEDKKVLSQARSQYRRFINDYFYSPLAPQATFELAQLEYQMGNYPEASKNFKKVAYETEANSFQRDAAYGYVWSETKRGEFDLNAAIQLNLNAEKNTKALPLTRPEKIFLNSARMYVEKYPRGERTQVLLYKISEVYFSKRRLDSAEIAIRRILADRENISLITLKALILSSEIHNIGKNWEKFASRSNQISSLSLALNIDYSKGVGTTVANDPKWEEALALEEKGRTDEAAELYETIGLRSGGSGFASEAFWRAANLYRATGDINKSNSNLKRITDESYRQRAQFLYIANDVRLLRYSSAARKFEQYSQANKDSPLVKESILAAAMLNKNLGKDQKFADLLVKYNTLEDNRLIWFLAMETYANLGKIESVARLREKVAGFGTESVIRADYLIARSFWNEGDRAEARDRCKVIKSSIESLEKGLETAVIMRAASECEYYNMTNVAEVEELIKTFEKRRHFDLIGKVYKDVGDLKQSEGEPFEALQHYQKAWKAIDENLFAEIGEEVFQRLVSLGKAPLLHKAAYINWGVARTDIIDWERPAVMTDIWEYGRSNCERGNFKACLDTIQTVDAQNPSYETKTSLIRALMMAGRENKAISVLKELGDGTNWAPQLVWMAHLLRSGYLVPADKNKLTIPVGENRLGALVARGYKEISEGKLSEAVKSFQEAVEIDPRYAPPYVGFAEIFYITRNFSLIKKVLSDGVRNTRNDGSLRAVSIMVEALDDPVVYGSRGFQEDYRVTYAKSFNELVNDRPNQATGILEEIEKGSVWKAELTYVKDLLGFKTDIEKVANDRDSRQLTWLKSIAGTKSGANAYMSVAQDYSNEQFSPNFHFLKISVRQRAPANIIRER